MQRRSDGWLVERARAGSQRARTLLFERHWTPAWRRAYAITGRRSAADDLAQEAIVAAFNRLDELRDPAAFGAWLGATVARRALDLLRSERHLDAEEPPEIAVEWDEPSGGRDDVRRAVAALDPDRRAVVVMRYWLDMTPAEIAAALELPAGTVNSRLGRAREDLRRALAAEEVR